MPNSYFRFRQFTVHQDKAAMKVCTDACLFGAWLSSEVRISGIKKMLDIGAGTGLLSLMVAQSLTGQIDAVEVDRNAYEEALDNFRSSPWSDRLSIFHTSIQQFNPGYTYDLIFTNPPFYEHDLQSPDEKKNVALHGTNLRPDELFSCARKLLKPGGRMALLIPFSRMRIIEDKMNENGFYMERKMNVKQTPGHAVFRCMYILNMDPDEKKWEKEIVIRNTTSEKGRSIRPVPEYTDEFNALLKDYYL